MQKTEFEAVTLDVADKTYDDITQIRAIMMTDDAICWVDDVTFKENDTISACRRMLKGNRDSETVERRLLVSGLNQKMLSEKILGEATPLLYLGKRDQGTMKNLMSAFNSSMESSWRNSEGCLKVILPCQQMALDPVFVLKGPSGDDLRPKINIVDDSRIRLMFDEKPVENDQYNLLIYTKYIACKLTLVCTGDEMVVNRIFMK